MQEGQVSIALGVSLKSEAHQKHVLHIKNLLSLEVTRRCSSSFITTSYIW